MAGLAPIDVNSRPVDFEFITNNTILLHESPVSSDVNNLFNSPNQVPVSRDRFFNRMSEAFFFNEVWLYQKERHKMQAEWCAKSQETSLL